MSSDKVVVPLHPDDACPDTAGPCVVAVRLVDVANEVHATGADVRALAARIEAVISGLATVGDEVQRLGVDLRAVRAEEEALAARVSVLGAVGTWLQAALGSPGAKWVGIAILLAVSILAKWTGVEISVSKLIGLPQ